MNDTSNKVNLDKLDKKLEEFKSKKENDKPKQLKVQNVTLNLAFKL